MDLIFFNKKGYFTYIYLNKKSK